MSVLLENVNNLLNKKINSLKMFIFIKTNKKSK